MIFRVCVCVVVATATDVAHYWLMFSSFSLFLHISFSERCVQNTVSLNFCSMNCNFLRLSSHMYIVHSLQYMVYISLCLAGRWLGASIWTFLYIYIYILCEYFAYYCCHFMVVCTVYTFFFYTRFVRFLLVKFISNLIILRYNVEINDSHNWRE